MTDINRLITSLKRRSAHAKEFGDDVTFVKLKDIDALVEALEKAQQRNVELENYAEAEATGADKTAEDSVYWMKRCKELESRTVTVKLPDDAEHDIMAPVAAYLSEKFKWDGSAARWDGRKEYDVLADRDKYALRMVIRRAAGKGGG